MTTTIPPTLYDTLANLSDGDTIHWNQNLSGDSATITDTDYKMFANEQRHTYTLSNGYVLVVKSRPYENRKTAELRQQEDAVSTGLGFTHPTVQILTLTVPTDDGNQQYDVNASPDDKIIAIS